MWRDEPIGEGRRRAVNTLDAARGQGDGWCEDPTTGWGVWYPPGEPGQSGQPPTHDPTTAWGVWYPPGEPGQSGRPSTQDPTTSWGARWMPDAWTSGSDFDAGFAVQAEEDTDLGDPTLALDYAGWTEDVE